MKQKIEGGKCKHEFRPFDVTCYKCGIDRPVDMNPPYSASKEKKLLRLITFGIDIQENQDEGVFSITTQNGLENLFGKRIYNLSYRDIDEHPTTTKLQKIEGGWEERYIEMRAKHHRSPLGDIRLITEEIDFISTEIEKAKAEAYKEGFDKGNETKHAAVLEQFASQQEAMCEIARVQERQRCVDSLPRGDIATSLEPREVMWSKGWNDYRDQAKHDLEQLK